MSAMSIYVSHVIRIFLKLNNAVGEGQIYLPSLLATALLFGWRQNQGRDSPIFKNDSYFKNPCFVTCVNSAFCS
jgi:hypothetical protein